MDYLRFKRRRVSTNRSSSKRENPLEQILSQVILKRDPKSGNYELIYTGKKPSTNKKTRETLQYALALLNSEYNQRSQRTDHYGRTLPPLEAMLPEIEKVPDGSLGHGTNGYGRSWVVLGTFTPSQNKIRLLESASDKVLNHELGHWFAHWMGFPQPTRQVAEYLAEKHQIDGRNLYDLLRNAQQSRSSYLAAA